jgi:hypothetical protein
MYGPTTSGGVSGEDQLVEDKSRFKQVVGDAFMKEIEKSKRFAIVDTLSAETLFVRGAVLDIVSRVPSEMAGRSDVYLASSGEATLLIDLIDAETGVMTLNPRFHPQNSQA